MWMTKTTGMLRRAVAVAVAMIVMSAALPAQTDSESGAEKAGLIERFRNWREERIAVTDTYTLSASGAGYAAIQDTRMAPRIYRAPGFVAVNQDRTYRPQEIVLRTLFFQFAYPLTNKTIALDASYINPRGTIDFAYLRRIGPEALSVGGSLSTTGNLRVFDALGNSSLNFDIISSLNAGLRWEDRFSLFGRPTRWYAQLTTPVVSYVVRNPAYSLSFQESARGFAAPWDLYRARLNLGLSRLLEHSNENRFSIDYFYDVYGSYDASTDHRLVLGNHTITFGYSLKSM